MKLNTKGASHIIVPLLCLIVVAVAGTFFMVSSYASFADKPTQPKITSAKYTMKSSAKGYTNKVDQYCANFVTKYKVRTIGNVNSVAVETFTQATSTGVDGYELKRTGKNLWTGTQDRQVCSDKRGRTKVMPPFTYLAAVARSADGQDKRSFPAKTVALR